MSAEVLDVVERLRRLGPTVNKDIEVVVSVAGQVLDSRKEDDSIIKQLLDMEKEWLENNEKHRKAMIAFLERYGIIPMGSAS